MKRAVVARWGVWVAAVAVSACQFDPLPAVCAPPGFQPVDDGHLLAPGSDDWVSYGRDAAGTHHSPLDQINVGNVAGLSVAWSAEIPFYPNGLIESTPLVRAGTLFVTGSRGVVLAFDAQSGETLWTWDPGIAAPGTPGGHNYCCGPVNRGVALYGSAVFVGTLDGRLVSLDAQTGEVVWERRTTPPEDLSYSITGAPRVGEGLVFVGNAGADLGVRGFVGAYDAATGIERWRAYTVPGDPSLGFESPEMAAAAETWAGQWWTLGGGGTAWDGITYDVGLGRLFVGVGNGSPWSRDHRSQGYGDNLFLASILALDAATGSLEWHFQATPGEEWDYTATQNLVLADLEIDGVGRPTVLQANKNGFFYVLDRETGAFVSAGSFADVTWAVGVDPVTGRPLESPRARYGRVGSWIAPGHAGAHSWEPMAWNPVTKLAYVPGENSEAFYRATSDFFPQPGTVNTGLGGGAEVEPLGERLAAPGSPAFLVAWDPELQAARWRVEFDVRGIGGALSAGRDLVFVSGPRGNLIAYDAVTGEEVWRAQVGGGTAAATPITYAVCGVQYVAVASRGRVTAFSLEPSR